jgi:hypothetical protein
MSSVLRLVRIVKLVYSLRQRNDKGLAAISHLIRLLPFAPQVAVYAKPTLNAATHLHHINHAAPSILAPIAVCKPSIITLHWSIHHF